MHDRRPGETVVPAPPVGRGGGGQETEAEGEGGVEAPGHPQKRLLGRREVAGPGVDEMQSQGAHPQARTASPGDEGVGQRSEEEDRGHDRGQDELARGGMGLVGRPAEEAPDHSTEAERREADPDGVDQGRTGSLPEARRRPLRRRCGHRTPGPPSGIPSRWHRRGRDRARLGTREVGRAHAVTVHGDPSSSPVRTEALQTCVPPGMGASIEASRPRARSDGHRHPSRPEAGSDRLRRWARPPGTRMPATGRPGAGAPPGG